MKQIALKEHLQLSKSECNSLYGACNDDIRQSILSLQFWGQKLVPNKEQKTKPYLKLKPLHTILWGVPNIFLHAPQDASVKAAVSALTHLHHHNLHSHFLESSIFMTKAFANTCLTIRSTKGKKKSYSFTICGIGKHFSFMSTHKFKKCFCSKLIIVLVGLLYISG